MKRVITVLMVMFVFVCFSDTLRYSFINCDDIYVTKVSGYIDRINDGFGGKIVFEYNDDSDFVIEDRSFGGNILGKCVGNRIIISGNDLTEKVFQHEFGHYMGMGHRSDVLGSYRCSVMGAYIFEDGNLFRDIDYTRMLSIIIKVRENLGRSINAEGIKISGDGDNLLLGEILGGVCSGSKNKGKFDNKGNLIY